MSNQATNPESSFADRRVEFVQEDSIGVTPENPSWNLYSDNLETAFVWSGDAQIEEQRGVGSVDANAHFAGPEDHTGSIEYHLQRFFADENSAAGDALIRGPDNNNIQNTHTIVDRGDHGSFRTFTVAKGAFPNIDSVEGDPGSGLPVLVSLEYEAKKVRSYRVYQPDAEALEVVSTSENDTMDITIESDDGTQSSTVTLDGTTPVSTTDTFDSIDAFELAAEAQGNVTISGEATGDELVTIYGADEYDGVEGDRGVPVLGSGSHEAEVGEEYERFLNDEISRDGESLAVEIRSAEFNVENNYDKAAVLGTKQQAIHGGERNIELSVTVAGNYESHESMSEHLRTVVADIEWTFDGGVVTFESAALTEAGEVGPEAGDAVSAVDSTFTPTGLNVE